MEGLEERRKRLAAMREQAAAQAEDGVLGSAPSPSQPPLLANPFEDSANTAAAEVKSSRFDFYTDPLAGFQGTKKRRPGVGILPMTSQALQSSIATPHSGAGILSSPSYQGSVNVYPHPGVSSWQPIEYKPTYPNPPFAHPQPSPLFYGQVPPQQTNTFPNQPSERQPFRGFSGRSNGRQSSSGPAGRGGFSGVGYSPGRGYDNRTDFGGRGNAFSGRSSGDSWRGDSRSEGRGAHGRGQGGGRAVSCKEQPHLFAKKSMLEDPWEVLKANNN